MKLKPSFSGEKIIQPTTFGIFMGVKGISEKKMGLSIRKPDRKKTYDPDKIKHLN